MITLTREEAQQVLDAFLGIEQRAYDAMSGDAFHECSIAVSRLRARLAQPEPEPDKYLMEVECTKCGAKQDGILTVNVPPQREWQGLTTAETKALWNATKKPTEFAEMLQAKLREKNG